MTRILPILSFSALLLACAARPVDDGLDGNASVSDSDEVVAGESSSSESESTGSESESTSSDSSSDSTESSSGDECVPPPKFDLPPDPNAPVPESCTNTKIGWDGLAVDFPDCMMCDVSFGCHYDVYLACVELGPGQTCEELCPSGNCGGFDWGMCVGEGSGWSNEPVEWCGPYLVDGQCCTAGQLLEYCAE
ncbi:MAG: hypothetical protein KC431_10950 [Myxococcales bacterium]|nr:hypothetical protein [Myxococcales bacterium]